MVGSNKNIAISAKLGLQAGDWAKLGKSISSEKSHRKCYSIRRSCRYCAEVPLSSNQIGGQAGKNSEWSCPKASLT